MSRLTRGGAGRPNLSREVKFSVANGDRKYVPFFLLSCLHEQDWQLYPVDSYSALRDDHINKCFFFRNANGRLDDVEDDAIRHVKIPTGEPFVYNFDADLRPIGEPNEHGFRGKFVGGTSAVCAVGWWGWVVIFRGGRARAVFVFKEKSERT